MKDMSCYLTFNGNCAEAMRYYAKCLKADLQIMPFSEMPKGQCPPGAQDRVMHANIKKGGAYLMASDTMPGMAFSVGNNFSISINCDNQQEVDEYFGALKEGGKVTMAPEKTFWGAYFAMCTDKFGVNWMFNYDFGTNK